MKIAATLSLLFLTIQPHSAPATWGFFAHKKINQLAVYTLPEQMNAFFLEHINYLKEHAIDADKRRYADPREAPRHYIDLDHYHSSKPFQVLPKSWKDAIAQFSEDTLIAYGILPWHIERTYYRLVEAMQKGEEKRVLRLAADLGHYVADAQVPLHCTKNYNGQLTGQKGIHALWETRLPKLFAFDYHYWVGKAAYEPHVSSSVWQQIESSFLAKDSVLLIEKQLQNTFPSDRRHSFEESSQKVYSEAYAIAYHQALDGMVQRKMQAAILSLGNLWYSAWIDAGQPDMQAW